jgi:citryl-CoA synthetase large subunit
MILYEFEGKQLLKDTGILVPNSQLILHDDLDSGQARMTMQTPLVLKAQVLSGNRAKAGGIVVCDEISNFQFLISNLFNKTINGEKVETILVEERVEIAEEYYLSITYDTENRGPILTFSQSGGTGIEARESKIYPIDILNPIFPQLDIPQELGEKLIKLFFQSDCLLLEINPLVKTKSGEWMALDAKVKLDDDAKFRHEDWNFAPRLAPGHNPTKSEIEAKKIDEGDYRGTAGSAYFDLEGDIAVLSSGGGVSLTAMDALIKCGGKPSNFTEYSGNPPREKVVKLTKIVLSKPNIHGLWIIGTVAANFTDIYETLMGIVDGLKEVEKELDTKFDFPIVIRRGGPREDEAFTALKEVKDFNLILQGEEISISESAKVMAEKAREYALRT